MKGYFNFSDKLRKYSSGISLIHKIIDIAVGIIIFLYASIPYLKINFYLYSFLIYLIIFYGLRDLYGSFRTRNFNYLTNEIFTNGILIIFFINSLNFFVIHNSKFLVNNSFIKSSLFLVYLAFSHLIPRFILRIYRIKGGNKRSIVLLGDLDLYLKIVNDINKYPWMGYKIARWFSFSKYHSKNNPCPQGNYEDMKLWLKENNPDLIIITKNEKYLPFNKILNFFGDTHFTVCYFENWFNLTSNIKTLSFGNYKLINIWGNSQSLILLFIKELLDKFLAFILILILLPFLVAIALSISITTKNYFLYKQNRVGKDGKIFKIYKFKTMSVNDSGEGTKLVQAKKHDQRITAIGSFLRSYSLDELPQIFNVLNGTMSFVGPRPHAVTHNSYYRKKIMGYMQRHKTKPGITGLAQVNDFRGETKTLEDMQKRINSDLEYINNWSIFLDLKILFKTLFKFNSKRAY